MDAQGNGGFVRRWAGAESTPVRRAIVGALVGALVLLLIALLIEVTGAPGEIIIIPSLLVTVGFGAFVRAWVAIPLAYGILVLVTWIGETAAFLYLGAGEWEARNLEHWQGDDPAWTKLLGQLLEYLVFMAFFVPFVAFGVVIGRTGRRLLRGPNQNRPSET